MLHCKFSGDCNSERIFKIGQYLTKLCVEHLGFTFFGPPCISSAAVEVYCVHLTAGDSALLSVFCKNLNNL